MKSDCGLNPLLPEIHPLVGEPTGLNDLLICLPLGQVNVCSVLPPTLRVVCFKVGYLPTIVTPGRVLEGVTVKGIPFKLPPY